MKKILLFLFLILSSTVTLLSQGETAIPILQYPVSPLLYGMGATGTSLPTDDPFGFLYNPAQLGYTSQENNF